jgi:hypothetical protein
MAETFLAVQRGAAGFEQRVCVKFVLPALRDDPGFSALFRREATIAASLRHSNIVGVIDVDQERGYMVLELVDGVDLRTLLNAAPNHRLPAHLVTLIALELCKALAYAHSRTRHGEAAGVVHRDISPSNVLISYAGEVKLTDFGIAKAMCSEVEPQSQAIKGKLCYMSPEQTRNEPLDGRSDLFSLGTVCYELLAGRRPFDGQTEAETILRLNQGEHTPLVEAAPDVPGGLASVVERALSLDRRARHANADAFIDALSRFAPPATAYRELGDFARQAQPQQTLSTEDMLEQAGPEHPPKAARISTRPMGLGSLATPEAGPLGTAAAGAQRGAAFTSVSLRAWGALAAASLLFAGVAAAWVAQERPGVAPVVAVTAIARKTAAPPALAMLVNAGRSDAAARNPDLASTLLAATAAVPPTAATASGTATPASAPIVPAPLSVPAATPERLPHAAQGQATLRVGTIPLGQVWIDGQVAGWSPVAVQLSPGRHTIAGGSDTPQVHKELHLRAGERRQVVLNLEEIAVSGPNSGATALASDR